MNGREAITIPVDTLLVARNVMKGSRNTLLGEVGSVVDRMGLNSTRGVETNEKWHISTSLIGKREFAGKKVEHPSLAIHSVTSLVNSYNAITRRNRDGISDYASGVSVGEVQYDEISEGHFIIGFMLSDAFRQRTARERTSTIDILLDTAQIPEEDPIRKWHDEQDDAFWLPVLKVATDDQTPDGMINEFCEEVGQKTSSLKIDLYDAKARMLIVDVTLAA